MRTIHPNRQARRTALCVRDPRPSRDEPVLFLRVLALRAHGGDLAQMAEGIADELELSPDLIDDLLSPGHSRP